METWIIAIWVVLFVLYLFEAKKVPSRLAALRRGKKGLLLVPVAFGSLIAMLIVADAFPILKWGWLGTNIAAAPIADISAGAISSGGLTSWAIIGFLAFAAALAFMCLLANYVEEEQYRGSWKMVGIWACLHLIMGIPIFAVIPIFSVGILYKIIHDRWSLDHAYCTHFFTNMTLVGFILVTLVVGYG
jgi:hypothetical protein